MVPRRGVSALPTTWLRLGIALKPGHPLQGVEDKPSSDATLALAMRIGQQAIDDEMVTEQLIADLAQRSE